MPKVLFAGRLKVEIDFFKENIEMSHINLMRTKLGDAKQNR